MRKILTNIASPMYISTVHGLESLAVLVNSNDIQCASDHFAQGSDTCIESFSRHSWSKVTLYTTEVPKQMFKMKSSRKQIPEFLMTSTLFPYLSVTGFL